MQNQVKIEPQIFNGVSGEIKAYLFTHSQASNQLAVILPGAGYSYREPLLYFGIKALLQKNYRVLALDKVYGDDPKWRSLSTEQEARGIVEQDTIQVFDQIKNRFPNELDLLFGRSLGTFAIACLLERNLVSPGYLANSGSWEQVGSHARLQNSRVWNFRNSRSLLSKGH